MGAPPNSLKDEEEDGGGEDEQQREREDPAVAGQHEAAAAVEAVAAREHLPLAPRAVADAAAAAAAPARCSGGRWGPGARTRGRGGAGAARPWGGRRRGGPGADLLVLTVLHAAAAGLASAPRGPAAPHRDPGEQRSWRRRAALAHSPGAAPPLPPPPARPPAAAPPPPGPGMALGPAPGPAPLPAPASLSARAGRPFLHNDWAADAHSRAFRSFSSKLFVGRPLGAARRAKRRDSVVDFSAVIPGPGLRTDCKGILRGEQGWEWGHNLI